MIDNFMQDGMISRSPLFGFKIVESPSRIKPKIQLSPKFDCSDEFRRDMNAWLLDMFGERDDSLIRPGFAYMFGNTIVMRPEMCAMLSNTCA